MINTMFVSFRLRYSRQLQKDAPSSSNSKLPKGAKYNQHPATIYVRVNLHGKPADLFSANIVCPAGRWDYTRNMIAYDEKKITKAITSAEYKQIVALANLRNININALLPDSNMGWLLQDEDYTYYLQNKRLVGIRNKLIEIEARYNSLNKILSIDLLKKEYYGEVSTVETLVQVAVDYQKTLLADVGKTLATSTYELYDRYVRVIKKYLKHTGQRNVLITQVGYTFANEFRIYLLKTLNLKNTYVVRIIRYFKQLMVEAQRRGLIVANSTTALRLSLDKAPKRKRLTPEQLDKIYNMWKNGEFRPTVAKSAEAFLFACHTGLAYSDYSLMNAARLVREQRKLRRWELMPPHIHEVDGERVLVGRRIKTNTAYCVPVTHHNYIIRETIVRLGSLDKLPCQTNVEINRNLKLIAAAAEIDIVLDFHTARKTFANLLLNHWRIRIESVIGIMGWKNIKEAEPYVEIENERIIYDFKTMQPRQLPGKDVA